MQMVREEKEEEEEQVEASRQIKASCGSAKTQMEDNLYGKAHVNSVADFNTASNKRYNCLCSPTTHAGSYRCRVHRNHAVGYKL